MKGLVDVHICYRDRPSELFGVLLSLYYQTYKNFRILISDDASGTPLQTYHFLNCIIMRLILRGNKVIINRNDFGIGVSKNRQKLVDISVKDSLADYIMRVDDDVILESDFIERLLKVIDNGYDLASGVTPPVSQPILKRELTPEILNRVILDNEGNYLFNGDDCGMLYYDDKIIPCHHFRSSALYKIKIHDKVNYLPTKLTKHGFREEMSFSYKCLMNGFKLGVDTGAIAWHQITPSGGERFADSNELIKQNEEILKEFTKEHKDELNKIFGQPQIDKLELLKETNLAGKI